MWYRFNLVVLRHHARKCAGVLALVPLLFFGSNVAASISPDISGTSCSQSGATRVSNKVRFTCQKLGGKRVWRPAVSAPKSPTKTEKVKGGTAAAPAVRPASEVVAEKINTYVQVMRSRNQAVPAIDFRFGPSLSDQDRKSAQQVAEAFFRYGSFSDLSNYRNAVVVATSQAELVETAATLQNVSNWGPISGAYIGTGTHSLVLANWGLAVLMGSELGAFRARLTIAHELSHGGKIQMMGYDPTKSSRNLDRMPMWFASGVSNVHAAMVLAALDGKPYKNLNITGSEALRCVDYPISRVSLSDGTGSSGCRGTGTGDFANELLVARFGIDRTLEFVRSSGKVPTRDSWPSWSSTWALEFQRLFMQSPESFEADVETYRRAVINVTELPPGFLEPRER